MKVSKVRRITGSAFPQVVISKFLRCAFRHAQYFACFLLFDSFPLMIQPSPIFFLSKPQTNCKFVAKERWTRWGDQAVRSSRRPKIQLPCQYFWRSPFSQSSETRKSTRESAFQNSSYSPGFRNSPTTSEYKRPEKSFSISFIFIRNCFFIMLC